jgi:glycosyltransferase involved in cell wall biosynthesis
VRALERAYSAYDRILEAAAANLGAHRPVVITTNPLVAGFSPFRWAGQVTFYAWDDWPAALALQRWWTAYDEAFARIRESGRTVVGVSQAVVDRIQPTGASVIIPNGVAPEEWLQPSAPPTWFAELPQPRILYAGAMTRERLSVEMLSEIAIRFAKGSLVLVGPILDRGMLDPLLWQPNVWIQPEVGRSEVASIIHAADVCIMPHRFNRLTMAMSPLKINDYKPCPPLISGMAFPKENVLVRPLVDGMGVHG